jgi:hypothetical protein
MAGGAVMLPAGRRRLVFCVVLTRARPIHEAGIALYRTTFNVGKDGSRQDPTEDGSRQDYYHVPDHRS